MNWPCLGKAVGVDEHVSLHWEAESSGHRPGCRIAGSHGGLFQRCKKSNC